MKYPSSSVMVSTLAPATVIRSGTPGSSSVTK